MTQPTDETFPDDLKSAGVHTVVDSRWRLRGRRLSDASTVRVAGVETADADVLVRKAIADECSVLVWPHGAAWVLGGASEQFGIALVLLVLPVDEGDGALPTAVQRDTADAIVAVLEALSFDAIVRDEIGRLPED